MWDLLEGNHLFFAEKNGMLNDEQHVAEMVSLLGPPPPEFLKRSEKCYQYWDSQGTTPKSLFQLDKDNIVLSKLLYNNNLLMSR